MSASTRGNPGHGQVYLNYVVFDVLLDHFHDLLSPDVRMSHLIYEEAAVRCLGKLACILREIEELASMPGRLVPFGSKLLCSRRYDRMTVDDVFVLLKVSRTKAHVSVDAYSPIEEPAQECLADDPGQLSRSKP